MNPQYRQVHLPDYYALGYHSLRAASSPNYMQPGKCSPRGWQSLEEGQNHHPGVPDLGVAKIQAQHCKVLHSSELEFLICRDVTYLKGLNMTIKQCYIHNPQGLLPSRCSTNICWMLKECWIPPSRPLVKEIQADRSQTPQEQLAQFLDSFNNCSLPPPPKPQDADPGPVLRGTQGQAVGICRQQR